MSGQCMTMPCVALPSQLVGCIPDGLPVPERTAFSRLDDALVRYYVLNGISDADDAGIDSAVTADDRERYGHLRTLGMVEPNGRMIEFMQRASQLPRAWCVTWIYLNDFAEVSAGAIPGVDREEYVQEAFETAVRSLES
jgi:hypothetical protein